MSPKDCSLYLCCRMHRILALVPYRIFPPQMGGQKGIALFYRALSRVAALSMLSVRSNKAAEPYTVHASIHDHKSRYLDPRVFLALRKEAKRSGASHLLFEHPYYAWLMVLCRIALRLPLIVHSHNIESLRFRSMGKPWWRMLWWYEKLAYRQADYLWFKTPEDRDYAVANYGVKSARCAVIPYGIDTGALLPRHEMEAAAALLRKNYGVAPGEKILLFNGTLSYGPNLDALGYILNDILPQLGTGYRLIVCGKGLPAHWNDLSEYKTKGVIYAGFVEDIDLYFKGCDVFLNPLLDGGGIKTKLVEALGFGKPSVSTRSGAIGVPEEQCGGRLRVVEDKDWQAFAREVIAAASFHPTDRNEKFYAYFHWPRIAERAIAQLTAQ